MEIREVTNKKEWEGFVKDHAPESGAFLHSWGYGEMDGGKRVGVYEGEELVGVVLVSETKLPFGISYGLILRGPIFAKEIDQKVAFSTIVANAKLSDFLRFEPLGEVPARVHKTIHVSPEETLVLDLSKTENELLSEMHSKTRYNIRLSERKGVVVRELDSSEFDSAWKIFEDTATRDSFRLHKKSRYKKWLEHGARLVGAFYEDELLAVNLMIDYAGTRTYLHGASSNSHRNLMAPYALQWHEIVGAKKAGLKRYDFWGISDTNPAWKGITRFKLGFGGERLLYLGTYDYVLKPLKYRLYKLLRAIRRR